MSELTLLKSGVSYLIFRERYKDGLVIRKFANSDNEKLLKEINRILDLRASYPTMHRRLPEIIDSGLVDEGIQAGRRYYRQRYVQGKTFSSLLARQPEAIENANIVANIENGLCACIAEMEPTRLSPAEYETRQKQWLKAELDRIAEQPLTGPLAHQDEIEIDGQTYRGLVASLGDLLDNEWKFGPADVGWSNLGHWNFHGDNILVADISRPNDFSIIDPDSGIDTADPVFSACRFLYSYPHDTAEYGKYTIQTHAYRRPGRPSFGISLLWTDSSIGLYEPPF